MYTSNPHAARSCRRPGAVESATFVSRLSAQVICSAVRPVLRMLSHRFLRENGFRNKERRKLLFFVQMKIESSGANYFSEKGLLATRPKPKLGNLWCDTNYLVADNCVAHRVTVGRFRGLIVFGGSDLHSPRRSSVRDSQEPALWLDSFYGWSARLSLSDW